MKKAIFTLLFTVCVISQAISQNVPFLLRGKVLDAATKLPLKNVSIAVKGTLNGAVSDSLGAFNMEVPGINASLYFSMLGYEKKVLRLDPKDGRDSLYVELTRKANNLNEVVIHALPLQEVSRSRRYHVLDYDFYHDGILMITYVDYPKAKLVLINHDSDTLGYKNIPHEPNRLFKDCLGNLHVVCKDSIYQVFYDGKTLRMLPAKSVRDFEKILLPCVAQDSSGFYLVEKYGGGELVDVGIGEPCRTHNLALRYLYIDKKIRQRNHLLLIADEHKMAMRADEADFEARKAAAGMDPTYDRLFAERFLFTEVYAPLFNINDRIYVFDYVNGKIRRISKAHQLMEEVPFTWHKTLDFQEEMSVDQTSGKVYALFESGGISELREINLQTGNIQKSYRLPFSFLTHIKVHQGCAYFIRKERGDDETRYLLRMRLD